MKARAAIYCRVSTKDQVQNMSLATQKQQCLEFCRRNDLDVDQIFIEEGESAKTTDRPEFKKLVQHCKEGRGRIQYLIVYSISRFARSAADHARVRAELKGYGVFLRSVTEPIDESSHGKFMETIFSGVAQLDNDVRAERTVAGMKTALERGRWTFVPPLGYAQSYGPDGKRTLDHDVVAGPLVRQAFEMFSSGVHSRAAVLKRVTTLGLRTRAGRCLSAQSFHNMLRNRLYAGRIVIKGWHLEAQGDFAALVDGATFDRVQHLLQTPRTACKGTRRKVHPDFPLRGFARCGSCDGPLTASWSTGRSKRYPYYACPRRTCRGVKVGRDKLETAFEGLLAEIVPDAAYLRLFREIVLDLWKRKQADAVKAGRALRNRIDILRTKKEKLVDAFVYRQAIDKETYDEQLDTLNQSIGTAQLEMEAAILQEMEVEGLLRYAEFLASNVVRIWRDANTEQKQRVQSIIFPEGVRFNAGRFGTAPTSLFFKRIEPNSADGSQVVTPEGFEPSIFALKGRRANRCTTGSLLLQQRPGRGVYRSGTRCRI